MMSLAVALPASAQSDFAAAYTFTTLAGYTLSDKSDGLGPQARFSKPTGIATDTNGNFFVVDESNSTIRRITAAGVVSTIAGLPGARGLADGLNSAARFWAPHAITTDRSGNVYVTDTFWYTVRKLTPVGTNWLVTTIAGQIGSPGTRDGLGGGARFGSLSGLTADSAGNLYVADGPIRKITPTGSNWVVSTVANFRGYTIILSNTGPDITNIVGTYVGNATGIAVDGTGSLLVTDSNTVSRLTFVDTNWVTTPLAGLSASPGSVDGLGADARFQNLAGIAADALGNIYVADGGHTLRTLTPQGAGWLVSTLAGSPENSGDTDGIGTNALFNGVIGVVTDSANNLVVTDSGNNLVRKVTAAGVVRTIAGSSVSDRTESTGSVDGVGREARFNSPYSVAVDDAGNVYVTDSGNGTIRVISPAGIVTTIAGSALNPGSADGVGSNARFRSPEGIAVDHMGNVFVADDSAIRLITPAAVVSTIAGMAGVQGDLDGPGAVARFSSPYDLAVDGTGNVFVADTGNGKIRKLTRTGANWMVTNLVTVGDPPYGLAVGDDGRFFVVNGGQIQQIALVGADWVVSTIASSSYGSHIAVDGANRLYLPTVGSRTVQQITPVGTNWIVSTIGGGTQDDFLSEGGNVDGAGAEAKFKIPYGVAADKAGNVYISDVVNNNIRKGVFSQFAPSHPVPYAPPPRDAALVVTLVPPQASGQWRFPWELGWRDGGVAASNLVAGNYPVEFRSRPGWLAIPPNVTVVVTNSVSFTNEYFSTLSAVNAEAGGSLTVNIGPSPPVGVGWRFLGDNVPFFPSGFSTNLSAGTYLIEFAPVNGFSKPPNQVVQVVAGLPRILSATYLLASAPPASALLPFPVPTTPTNQISDVNNLPFGFNGQLQSDTGYGSGVAVGENVVLTAAHLVFSDQTLSYVGQAYWYFRQEKGLFEPQPLPARGWYLLRGYAAQRTNDVLGGLGPEASSPQSRNLDVAALYFLSPVAGGGHGGYLPSDAVPNPWLTGSSLKMLVGYPVDGSLFGNASVVPGLMYQTDPQPYPLTLATEPVANQQVYAAPWFLSYPGNSGGPVYAQFNGTFYPAAVYLGTLFNGTQPYASAVRAIDSGVTNLIALAASQGDTGTNYTGGGVITIIPSQGISANNPGYVQWQLGPLAAVQAGAGWRLQGDATYSSLSNYTRAVFSTNAFAVEFKSIAGWISPTNRPITVLPGQLLTFSAVYTVDGSSRSDHIQPTVTIVSPLGNARLFAALTNLVGTAKDNVAVDHVEVQVGSGSFQRAVGTSNWSAQIQFVLGTNIVRVRSIDSSGNISLTNTRRFVHLATAPLSLRRQGNGMVAGATNGQRLEIGKGYTLTATPGLGSVFSNWVSGGISYTNPVLKFQMVSNLQVFANFVTNPFTRLKGAYNGLFLNPSEGERSHQNSGFFTLTLTENGAFTGKLLLAGATHPASGQFDLALHARKTVVRVTNTPLLVDLQLMSGSDEINGTVSNAAWASELSGDRAAFSAASNPAMNLAGNYTLLLSGENDSGPLGPGFATLMVDKAGSVKWSATLADAVALQTVPVAASGWVPLYLPLYAGKGSLFGWVRFIDTLTNCLEGRLLWTKPNGVVGQFYPKGFTNEVTTLGSTYRTPPLRTRVLALSNALVMLEGGNLSSPLVSEATLNTLNKISVSSSNTNQLTLTITLASGLLNGSFLNPDTKKLSPIKGVVLQKQNGAAGFFLGTNQSGRIWLSR